MVETVAAVEGDERLPPGFKSLASPVCDASPRETRGLSFSSNSVPAAKNGVASPVGKQALNPFRDCCQPGDAVARIWPPSFDRAQNHACAVFRRGLRFLAAQLDAAQEPLIQRGVGAGFYFVPVGLGEFRGGLLNAGYDIA